MHVHVLNKHIFYEIFSKKWSKINESSNKAEPSPVAKNLSMDVQSKFYNEHPELEADKHWVVTPLSEAEMFSPFFSQ